jgi:hypothetical protein
VNECKPLVDGGGVEQIDQPSGRFTLGPLQEDGTDPGKPDIRVLEISAADNVSLNE